jgi:hypothetical protein
MRLLKILFVIFAVYFIRRFIHMYRVMKNVEEQQQNLKRAQPNGTYQKSQSGVINADFKVID